MVVIVIVLFEIPSLLPTAVNSCEFLWILVNFCVFHGYGGHTERNTRFLPDNLLKTLKRQCTLRHRRFVN